MSNPVEEVLSTNAAFYEALATGDFGLMQKVWSNTDDVTCIHPGWGSIFGRQSVMRSWETILQSPPQIACTEPRGFVSGDSAYVIAYENLGDGRLIATNLFRLEDDAWKMIHHQAGVARPASTPQRASHTSIH
tara:strand:- start:170 stop:568 length:399 start_codon:yes stop_codon:yes gene_type:complete